MGRDWQAKCPEGMKEDYNIVCQSCRKECDTVEQVHTGEDWEWWCYCRSCDIETFHPCYVPIEEINDQSEISNDGK